jgi:hypothetical protein
VGTKVWILICRGCLWRQLKIARPQPPHQDAPARQAQRATGLMSSFEPLLKGGIGLRLPSGSKAAQCLQHVLV